MEWKKGQRTYEIIVILFLFLFISFILRHLPGHVSDTRCWRLWITYIHENGLSKAYHSGTNYLPFYQYIMYLYGLMAGSAEAIAKNIAYLRLFTLVFDVLGLYFIYKWVDKKTSLFILILFSMLNVAYSYNSIIWGQVDGISASFVFASLYYAWKKEFVLSSFWMILAINMKMQSIIFLPVYGLLFLAHFLQERNWKTVLWSVLVTGGMQLLLLFPFMLDSKPIPSPTHVMNTYTSTYPVISMNAYNFWYWFIADPMNTPDEGLGLFGLPYKRIGLLLFLLFSFFALLPMLRMVLKAFKEKDWNAVILPRQQLWLISALVALLFFYLNTQMHERYCHPAFIFLTAYAFYSKDFVSYILFSLAYLLNLEGVLQFLQLDSYDGLIFNPSFIAVLYGLSMIAIFIRIYYPYKAVLQEEEVAKEKAIAGAL